MGRVPTPSTKRGKPRTIEPPPIAFEYLRAERVKQLENRLRAGPAWNNPDDLVFTNREPLCNPHVLQAVQDHPPALAARMPALMTSGILMPLLPFAPVMTSKLCKVTSATLQQHLPLMSTGMSPIR